MKNFDFDSLKKEKLNSNIIAEGEMTGHKHQLITADPRDFMLYKNPEDECLLLKLLKKAEIKHEEHHAIPLTPGNYRSRIVREYDHLKEEARKVID
jgi:hypothetical protein